MQNSTDLEQHLKVTNNDFSATNNDDLSAWINIGLDHLSPSQLKKPLPNFLFEYVYLKSRRKDMRPNCKMYSGGLAHDLIQAVAQKKETLKSAVKKAETDLTFYSPRDEDDAILKERCAEQIGDIIEQGVGALKELNVKNPEIEKRIEIQLDGIAIPCIGFVDLIWEKNFIELKTKWRSINNRAATLPNAPPFGDILQSAIYWKATSLSPRLIYVRDMGVRLFDQNNCEQLTTDNLERCLDYARQTALRRQNLLKLSSEFKDLAKMIEPDFDSFYWNIDVDFRKEAEKLWRI